MAEVTASSLREVLSACLGLSRGGVRALVSEPIEGKTTSFTSEVVRLHIDYAFGGSRRPATLIVKTPSLDARKRAVAEAFRLYEREVHFYRSIALGASLAVPACLHAEFHAHDQTFLLVIEDCTDAAVGDQLAGLSLDQLCLAVDEIAAFQAAWWERHQLRSLDWMPQWDDRAILPMVREGFRGAWPTFLRRFAGLIPPAVVQVGGVLPDRMGRLLDRLASPPHTITHGDYRADNLLFGVKSGAPALRVIDWQLACRGRGAVDVAYLMTQSAQREVRRTAESEVLDRYHARLVHHGVQGYSRADCELDYRMAALYCLVYPVLVSAFVDEASPRQVETLRAVTTRVTAAIVDLKLQELVD